jgi:hypothetical protein
MPDLAPKVQILSWTPAYGEVRYLIGDKKYVATGVSPFQYKKVVGFVKHGANNKAIQYLKDFDVERSAPMDKKAVAQELARVAGMLVAVKKPSVDALVKFFVDNPNPPDKKLHDWAEKNGWEVDDVEEMAYQMATKMAIFLTTGASVKKGFTEKDADPKEIELGYKVEKEHTDDKETQLRIILDHLVGVKNYYTSPPAAAVDLEKETKD